jgi:hypothetical protein
MKRPSHNVVDLPVRRHAKASSGPGQVGTWRGGYIRRDQRGRRVYYIAKRIGGQRFEVSTRCDREGAAEEHYKRFLLDPAGYTPTPPQRAREKPLVLDEELAARFLDWSLNVKGNSPEWVACQRQSLAWWAMNLGDTDLHVRGGDEEKRQWLREHVKKPLERAKSTGQRIAVLARFFSWLRKVALEVSPSTDPTFGMLDRPSPGKPSSDKKAITEARFQEIRAELEDGPYRWAFDVLMATGRHVREIRRFAQAGAIDQLHEGRPLATEGLPKAAAVLALPLTKAGVPARVPVSAEVAESACKLLAHGVVPQGKFGKGWSETIHDACEAADIKSGRVPAVVVREYEKACERARSERKRAELRAAFRRKWLKPAESSGLFHLAPYCDDFLGHAKGTGEKHYGRHVPLKLPTMI